MCGEPNQIIDEMIMQKQNYEQEQRRLEERKQFCSECYSKLIDGQCQRCIAAHERPQICD